MFETAKSSQQRAIEGVLSIEKRVETERLITAQSACFKLVYDSGERYVNDHCIIRGNDGLFHLFHIVGPVGKTWYDHETETSIGHATSTNLEDWEIQPDILHKDPQLTHEAFHIYAPYVAEKDKTFHLFYSGNNMDSMSESMCLAVSEDLFHWEKYPYNPIFRPSRSWAEYNPGSGIWACCRDAHVLMCPEYGYVLYYVTWIKGTRGMIVALGAAISENLVLWQDVGPVMIRERAIGHATTSMESPCVVKRGDLYYLFYKHRDETRLVISDDPLNFTDKEDCWFSAAHAAEVLQIEGKWYISSCSRQLEDIQHKYSDRTRGLSLACLKWDELMPEIVPFEKI
jgi:arabinan endo-1,5-alpha-L-arabinosidase